MALTNEQKASRRRFRKQYSKTTENIVKDVLAGRTSNVIAQRNNVSVGTVAATKANFSRDAYFPYVYRTREGIAGSCAY